MQLRFISKAVPERKARTLGHDRYRLLASYLYLLDDEAPPPRILRYDRLLLVMKGPTESQIPCRRRSALVGWKNRTLVSAVGFKRTIPRPAFRLLARGRWTVPIPAKSDPQVLRGADELTAAGEF